MPRKCRHAKSYKQSRPPYWTACICKSSKAPYRGPTGARDSDKDAAVMGWSDGTGWWERCMGGKDRHGVTPSNCVYY